ncbi:MAG: hypothetical protein ACLRNW_23610 [Neglectibacter sp.]
MIYPSRSSKTAAGLCPEPANPADLRRKPEITLDAMDAMAIQWWRNRSLALKENGRYESVVFDSLEVIPSFFTNPGGEGNLPPAASDPDLGYRCAACTVPGSRSTHFTFPISILSWKA